jgi:hypothetical protein
MATKVSDHSLHDTDFSSEPQKLLMPIKGFENMPLVSLEKALEPLQGILSDIETYVHVSKHRCENPPTDGLTFDESASIMIYTMEWEPRDGCLYVVLNRTLRAENRSQLKPWFLYLKLIITALSKLPSSHCTIYRGIRGNFSDRYNNGRTFVWWGFSSCTNSLSVLENDQFVGKSGTRTIFAIECYSAKDIRKHSYFGNEGELLLLPARQFDVIGSFSPASGLQIIQVKEIEPPFPLISLGSDYKSNSGHQMVAQPLVSPISQTTPLNTQ